jgi:hypothetical protein
MKFLNDIKLPLSDVIFSKSKISDLPSTETIYAGSLSGFAGASDGFVGDEFYDSIVVYSLNASDFSAAKFIVFTVSGSDMVIREILGMHDGVDGFVTEYAIVSNTVDDSSAYGDSFTFDFSSGGSFVNLVLSPASPGERRVVVHATAFGV